MQLTLSPDDLRPLVAQVVASTLEQLQSDSGKLGEQMAFSEAHAARLLGLNTHQLRDERLRGRIAHSKIVGNGIRYSRADLMGYLSRNRSEASS